MRERIVIVLVAIAIGLIVTTLVFFLYQQTKTLPNNIAGGRTNDQNGTEETVENNVALTVVEPADESLSDRRSIEVKGTTDVGNVIVISTNQEDILVTPTNDGEFSATIDIDAGVNKLMTRAIAPNGDSREDLRIVTFSTEEF